MNTAFHALAGLAIGQTAAARLVAAEHEERPPGAPDDGRARYARVTAYTFLLCVMSHGVLDGLPHEYPLRALGDTLWTTGLVAAWMLFIRPRYRLLLAIAFLGAELPDLIDHVPRDLDRHLGLHLPVLPKLFPWHHREGSGSLSGDVPPMARVASLVNHVIVVTFSATLMWISRRALRDDPR
ncbi:MAG TPA: hypothetical protein VHL80_07930 [Polyangia bacterium]|nr:hypothetical protein [Polyangia bacterium]